MEEEKKFEPMGTKVDPAMAVVWNAVCEALGTDTYHMLQHFIYSMIRAASDHHNKTPEIQKLLDALELDPGWQNAINLCAPCGRLSISQMVLIVEQKDKQGFGMVMLDKPYCGDVRQTENTNLIIERVIEVGFKKLYKKLRLIKEKLKCNWLCDVLLTMIEEQDRLSAAQEDLAEMRGQDNYAENGRLVEYGKKNKRIRHRTPDSLANSQQRIIFDETDRELAAYEAEDWEGEHRQHEEISLDDCHNSIDTPEDLEDELGFRPFTHEW